MRKTFLFLFFLLSILHSQLKSQELQGKITVLSNRIGSQVDHKIFETLQASLNDFINNRKWTNEAFQGNEKIVCNFLLNLNQAQDNNVFQASLTVQAARPVYNSSYQSPLVNFKDESVIFRYVQFQPLDFNETRIQGSEPFAANLTAVFSYYIYMILGFDFDSYSLRGGDPYFQKAQNIVNNAPEGNSIVGWKPFDGVRNRYWLIENITNAKYTAVHDAYYSYFRSGLDQMYEKENEARTAVLSSLSLLNTVNTENPNTMIIDFFFQGKANELSKLFKKGNLDEKSRALDYLSKLDISNINRYKQELQ